MASHRHSRFNGTGSRLKRAPLRWTRKRLYCELRRIGLTEASGNELEYARAKRELIGNLPLDPEQYSRLCRYLDEFVSPHHPHPME